MKRKALLLTALLTLCVITSSALLVGHFVQLNYDYIVHPETSPGYSENTPFGDGGDVWREKGIYLPTSLLVLLVLFNTIGVAMHFFASPRGWRVFIIASATVMLATALGELLGVIPLTLVSISFMLLLPELLLVPAGIVCAIAFLARKKPLLAGHTALLALSMAASSSLEWFSCYLYLD